MEFDVLHATSVNTRLDKFVCAAAYVDQVPFVDVKNGKEVADQNRKLQEELLEEVVVPAFAIVRPDFDVATASDQRKLLAVSFGLIDDPKKLDNLIVFRSKPFKLVVAESLPTEK